jgi:hypothetical protein
MWPAFTQKMWCAARGPKKLPTPDLVGCDKSLIQLSLVQTLPDTVSDDAKCDNFVARIYLITIAKESVWVTRCNNAQQYLGINIMNQMKLGF